MTVNLLDQYVLKRATGFEVFRVFLRTGNEGIGCLEQARPW